MSNPDENQTTMAMAALKAGYYPWRSMKDRFRVRGPLTTTLVAEVVEATPLAALAAAAEALGLEPDPILSESQKEALLIVAEVSADLNIYADGMELGAISQPDAEQLYSWAAELERPAQALATLFDLAPKESTPEPASSVLPTPIDLHLTIGQARGLIQTAIGQAADLDLNYATEHLWSASLRLTGAANQIDTALAARAKATEGADKP